MGGWRCGRGRLGLGAARGSHAAVAAFTVEREAQSSIIYMGSVTRLVRGWVEKGSRVQLRVCAGGRRRGAEEA